MLFTRFLLSLTHPLRSFAFFQAYTYCESITYSDNTAIFFFLTIKKRESFSSSSFFSSSKCDLPKLRFSPTRFSFIYTTHIQRGSRPVETHTFSKKKKAREKVCENLLSMGGDGIFFAFKSPIPVHSCLLLMPVLVEPLSKITQHSLKYTQPCVCVCSAWDFSREYFVHKGSDLKRVVFEILMSKIMQFLSTVNFLKSCVIK